MSEKREFVGERDFSFFVFFCVLLFNHVADVDYYVQLVPRYHVL